MDLSRYPNAGDVEILLKASSLWPSASNPQLKAAKEALAREQCDIGAQSSVSQWENQTSWLPFLAPAFGSDDEVQVHDLYVNRKDLFQNGVIRLDSGLQRLDALTIDGTVFDIARTIKKPDNMPLKGKSFEWLQIPRRGCRALGDEYVHVQATGWWGRVKTCPAECWQTMLQGAAFIALTQVENLQNIASISMESFNKAFDTVGVIQQKDLVTIWGKDYSKVAARWARTT